MSIRQGGSDQEERVERSESGGQPRGDVARSKARICMEPLGGAPAVWYSRLGDRCPCRSSACMHLLSLVPFAVKTASSPAPFGLAPPGSLGSEEVARHRHGQSSKKKHITESGFHMGRLVPFASPAFSLLLEPLGVARSCGRPLGELLQEGGGASQVLASVGMVVFWGSRASPGRTCWLGGWGPQGHERAKRLARRSAPRPSCASIFTT